MIVEYRRELDMVAYTASITFYDKPDNTLLLITPTPKDT